MRPSRIAAVWIVLVAATLATFAVGESGGAGTAWAVPLVFTLAVLKGLGVALDFMGLRVAPALWRRAVVGWLVVVVALLLLLWGASGVVTLPPPR